MPVYTRKERLKTVLNTAEVASLIGITKQSLLNWIRQGRVIDPERNPANNYRMWSEGDVQRLREMIREKQLAKTGHR